MGSNPAAPTESSFTRHKGPAFSCRSKSSSTSLATPNMVLGLLAAGRGERLRADGFAMAKGLVEIDGQPLVQRTIDAFVRCGISRISIIVNEESEDLLVYLREMGASVPIAIHVESTPSSLHSLGALAVALAGDHKHFFLTTVDAIYDPAELCAFVRAVGNGTEPSVATLAITRTVEDESPLPVAFDAESGRITAIGEEVEPVEWITGGLYHFPQRVLMEIPALIAGGMHRLRRFQAWLLTAGYDVRGCPFGTMIDVDHASDVDAAEQVLAHLKSTTK